MTDKKRFELMFIAGNIEYSHGSGMFGGDGERDDTNYSHGHQGDDVTGCDVLRVEGGYGGFFSLFFFKHGKLVSVEAYE